MDESKIFVHANPRENANIAAILFWTWTLKFFKIGYRKAFELTDLYDPLKSDKSDALGDRLEREWNRELDKCRRCKQSPSLLKTILRCFWWEYFLLGLLQIWTELILRLGIPMLIGGLLRSIKSDSFHSAAMYAAGICIATGLSAISTGQGLYSSLRSGGKIRIAICSLVYRKALRLSLTALGETSPGKVINLVASDVNRFDLVSVAIHYMWSGPIMTIFVGYLLYAEAGLAGMLGIVVVIIIVLIQSYTGKLTSIFRLQTAVKTDERIRLMDEIISGVRVIKMYAWEKPFCAMVELARRLELRAVRKTSWIRGQYMTFNLFTPRLMTYCTLVGMIFLGQPLSAEKVFVFSAYYSALTHTMTAMFIRGVAEIAECTVAVGRLQSFLMYEELQVADNPTVMKLNTEQCGLIIAANKLDATTVKDSVNGIQDQQERSNTSISLKNLTTRWGRDSLENILENVNIDIERGKLYIVIGAVGAGKSSLISTILGEMWVSNGCIDTNGDISYASQDSWVFGSTVRQNILFGQPYDRQRYQTVIRVCALLSDFKQFPQGDQTVVGERGISLSGGQKARINLARSIYRQADIYILDDPLSAVDAHVSKHLFEECIQKYLASKTRILATHQLQYLKEADGILLLEHGKLSKFVNYIELSAERTEYAGLFGSDPTSQVPNFQVTRRLSNSSNRSHSPFSYDGVDDGPGNADQRMTANIEDTSERVIKGSVYSEYFKAGGSCCFIITVGLFFLVTQSIVTFNDLYFSMLVDVEEKRYDRHLKVISNATVYATSWYEYPNDSTYGYINVYTGIVVMIFVVGLVRSLLLYTLTLGASQRLHDRAFGALIRTGIRFFDTNPSGRILNRFSKDMGAIDELLPKALLDTAQVIMVTCGALLIVCIVNPVFIVAVVVIGFACYWVRKVYLRTSKSVKRLEGVLRAPVFTHLNTTLNGLSTIRAFGAQEVLKSEFDRFQDMHSSAWYMFIATAAAFAFVLDILCSSFVTIVTFTLLLIGGYSRSEVGISITTIIALANMLQWGARQSAEVENQMTAVERVLEYTLLPPEDSLSDSGLVKRKETRKGHRKDETIENKLAKLPVSVTKDWPTEGCIKFHNVSMRYADDELPVLKELNFTIKPREKIGIVGRTGAGKSSLISALFRLAKVEGVIEIDGLDTGRIHLEELRRHMSIIPQDPILFSGTLRKNLDPFSEFSDENLWAVLEEVELKNAVISDVAGLESRVFDRGANYSVGQRQLVCLARAILRNNKILMLDEATANVDPHTDSLIQKTIRIKFSNCTVLTIAHRLNTIADSDRVLVMDKGQLIEFDHPHLLLQNESGQFTSLVKETGRAMYDQLSKVSEESYFEK